MLSVRHIMARVYRYKVAALVIIALCAASFYFGRYRRDLSSGARLAEQKWLGLDGDLGLLVPVKPQAQQKIYTEKQQVVVREWLKPADFKSGII